MVVATHALGSGTILSVADFLGMFLMGLVVVALMGSLRKMLVFLWTGS